MWSHRPIVRLSYDGEEIQPYHAYQNGSRHGVLGRVRRRARGEGLGGDAQVVLSAIPHSPSEPPRRSARGAGSTARPLDGAPITPKRVSTLSSPQEVFELVASADGALSGAQLALEGERWECGAQSPADSGGVRVSMAGAPVRSA